MPVLAAPRRSSALPRPGRLRPARLVAVMLLLGVPATACATTSPGLAMPGAGSVPAAVRSADPAAADPTSRGSIATIPSTPTTRETTAPTTTAPITTAPITTATITTATITPRPPSAPSSTAWSVVPPAALQTWQALPADDVSLAWRSGACVLVVSAPGDVPDTTDERFARAHVRYAVSTWIAQVDPTIAETGDHLSRGTDPLLVSDPTRTAPPAVHLQLSGFRSDFPTIGVTDQTYAFVTQGGGQGFVVSTVCSQEDFASRYDTEIAPLVADLGVDTGI